MIGRGGTGSCPIAAASGRSSAAPYAGSGWSETTCEIKFISVQTFILFLLLIFKYKRDLIFFIKISVLLRSFILFSLIDLNQTVNVRLECLKSFRSAFHKFSLYNIGLLHTRMY